jgi:GNAT superfamily N-acetyltransferase
MDYRGAKAPDLKIILPLAYAYAEEQAAQHPHLKLAANYQEFVQSGLGQAIAHPAAFVCVAEENGVAVGYAVGQLQEPPPVFEAVPYVFLSDLYVKPEFRGQGVEQALVERIRGWGLLQGATRFSSVAITDSAQAQALAAAGYRRAQDLWFLDVEQG